MAVQALNGGTYENMQDTVEKGLKADEQISEFEQKLAESEETISTLTTERDTFSTQATEAQAEIEGLNATVEELNGTVEGLNGTVEELNGTIEELNQFKTNVETKEKEAIIAKYALRLDEEKIEAYTSRIAEFTISDLEKELALELVAHDPSIFSAQGGQNGFIPKSEEYEEGSLEALLSKYQKK
jgi:chromosome segregation ATPase